MRILLLVLALLAACHRPSLKDQARSLGAGAARVGGKLVAVVKPVTPDAKVLASVAAQQALANQQPITIQKSITKHEQQAPAPAPAPSPEPTVIVHRVDAAKPTQFVLHGTTHGGKSFCKSYPTMDECTNSCTQMLRMTMLRKPEDGDMKSCSCTELDNGC